MKALDRGHIGAFLIKLISGRSLRSIRARFRNRSDGLCSCSKKIRC